MSKLLDRGKAFLVVALICFAAGVTTDRGATFIALGAFWLIIAFATNRKDSGTPSAGDEETPSSGEERR